MHYSVPQAVVFGPEAAPHLQAASGFLERMVSMFVSGRSSDCLSLSHYQRSEPMVEAAEE